MLVEYRPSFQNPTVMSQWPVFIQSCPPSNREISPHVSIFAIENWFKTSVFVTAGVWDCYFGLTRTPQSVYPTASPEFPLFPQLPVLSSVRLSPGEQPSASWPQFVSRTRREPLTGGGGTSKRNPAAPPPPPPSDWFCFP